MKNIIKIQPSGDLYEKIVSDIHAKRIRLAKMKCVFFTASSFVFLMAVVLSFNYVLQGFTSTGFWNYFSLMFSDVGTVFVYWKEYLLSLVESFPVVSFTFFLLMTLLLLGSVRLIIRNILIFNKSKYGH